MILGTTIFKLDGNPYYTPAFGKQGNAALFSIEVSHVSESPTLGVEVQHRNPDDTTFATAGTFTGMTATGVYSKDVTGLKQILRLKLTVTGATPTAAVHYILPEPSWRPN